MATKITSGRPTSLYTIEQMRQLEALADAAGHSYDAMMELAGKAVAQAAMEQIGTQRSAKLLVVAGPGNNGGDGLVAARYLAQAGHKVIAVVWRRPTPDPQGEAAKAAGVALMNNYLRLPAILAQVDGVIDALFGTGLSRPIEGEAAALLEQVAVARKRYGFPLIGVDGPSGFNGDSGAIDPKTVAVDRTITFGGAKVGMIAPDTTDYLGKVTVADIGIAPEISEQVSSVATWLDVAAVAPLLPKRSQAGHKGTFGTVMVVGGSINYVGAPALSALAAGRSGAGLVTLAVPLVIQPMLAARSDLTSATWLPLAHDFGALRKEAAEMVHKALEKVSALVVGPGLGMENPTKEFVYTLLGILSSAPPKGSVGFVGWRDATPPATAKLPPMVIDADALNALAAYEGNWWESLHNPIVLTPHPAELGRLLKRERGEIQAHRLEVAREAAERFGQVVVLKGAYTIVAAPDGRVAVNSIATSALAKAGSGDVLAGVIGALLAQRMEPYEAAIAGVVVHGRAGERLAEERGTWGGIASDLIELVGRGWGEFGDAP